MGNKVSETYYAYYPDPRTKKPITSYWYGQPCIDPGSKPTFDPMLGFPNGRKEKEMTLSLEQMIDAQIPPEHRNYCADKYLEVKLCYRDQSLARRFFLGSCKGSWHNYEHCRNELDVSQYKEYERERRLLARQQRRIAKGLEPDPNAMEDTM